MQAQTQTHMHTRETEQAGDVKKSTNSRPHCLLYQTRNQQQLAHITEM